MILNEKEKTILYEDDILEVYLMVLQTYNIIIKLIAVSHVLLYYLKSFIDY